MLVFTLNYFGNNLFQLKIESENNNSLENILPVT